MRKAVMLLGCAIAVGTASNAEAGLAGYEGFAGYTAGDIAGQTGSGNVGFAAGAWQTNGGGGVANKNVIETGLSYNNGGTLITSGGALQSSGGYNRAYRGITTPIDPGVAGGGSLWISYLFQSGPNTEDGNQVRFYTGGTDFDGETISADVVRNWPSLTQAVASRTWYSGSANGGESQFRPTGQTNLILMEYTLDDSSVEGNQGVVRMYVNPTIGGAAPDHATAATTLTGQGDYSLMTALSFFSPGAGGYTVTWDEVRWGDSFAAVTPVEGAAVPEPTGLALLGLAAVPMLRRRRA